MTYDIRVTGAITLASGDDSAKLPDGHHEAMILPYGVPTDDGRQLVFAAGSVADRAHVPVLLDHAANASNVVGRVVSTEETTSGKRGVLDLTGLDPAIYAKVQAGHLATVSAGVLIKDYAGVVYDESTDTLIVTEAAGAQLGEVSLVAVPAFGGAMISNSLSDQIDLARYRKSNTNTNTPEEINMDLENSTPAPATIDMTPVAAAITEMGAALAVALAPAQPIEPAVFVTNDRPVYGPGSQFSYFGDAFAIKQGNPAAEAQARMMSFAATRSNASGIVPTDTLSNLLLQFGELSSPIWDACTQVGLTDPGPFVLPVVTARPSAATLAEGVNPTPADVTAAGITITPSPVGVSSLVTRSLLESSNPIADALVSAELIAAWNEYAEVFLAAVLTGASGTNTLTAVSGQGDELVLALRAGLAGLYTQRMLGRVANGIMEPDAFAALATAVDTTGRPLLPSVSPSNADGTFSPGFGALDFSGISLRGSSNVTGFSYLFPREAILAMSTGMREFTFAEKQGPALIEIAGYGHLAANVRRASNVMKVAFTAV